MRKNLGKICHFSIICKPPVMELEINHVWILFPQSSLSPTPPPPPPHPQLVGRKIATDIPLLFFLFFSSSSPFFLGGGGGPRPGRPSPLDPRLVTLTRIRRLNNTSPTATELCPPRVAAAFAHRQGVEHVQHASKDERSYIHDDRSTTAQSTHTYTQTIILDLSTKATWVI